VDPAVARVQLVSMLGGPDARPALADTEVDALLTKYARADRAGLWPSAPGYVPTWNLNAAAAEGFRWKAARVAADFNFSADNASYSKGDVMAKLLEMEAHYAALDHGALTGDDPGDYESRRLWL